MVARSDTDVQIVPMAPLTFSVKRLPWDMQLRLVSVVLRGLWAKPHDILMMDFRCGTGERNNWMHSTCGNGPKAAGGKAKVARGQRPRQRRQRPFEGHRPPWQRWQRSFAGQRSLGWTTDPTRQGGGTGASLQTRTITSMACGVPSMR